MQKNYDDMTMEELMTEVKWEIMRVKQENKKLIDDNERLKAENKRLLMRLQHSEQERFKQFYS